MPLNQLIAQGGTQIRSPVQRYMETRKQMENEDRNRLAIQSQQQDMLMRQKQMSLNKNNAQRNYDLNVDRFDQNKLIQDQTMAMNKQKNQADLVKRYAKAITPIMQIVNKQKDKQSAYTQALPELRRIAKSMGIPVDQLKEQFDQVKTDALIKQNGVFEKAPTGRKRQEGVYEVYDEYNKHTGKFEEVSRGIKSQATGSYGDLSKPATTDLQKQLTKNLLSKDKITTGINFVMKNQHLFDVGSKMSAGVGNALELVGVDAPDFLRKEIADMADLKTYSLNIVNGIRKEVTGAAASYKELNNYINPLVSVATDGRTRAIRRMQSLVLFNELTTVRLNRLLSDGYKVSSKQGDKTMVLTAPDGKRVAVEKAFPLSSITTYKTRKGQLLEELAQGKEPVDFSDQEKQSMFKSVMQQMTEEGYNTDVPRKGWDI